MKIAHLGMTYAKCTRFQELRSVQLAEYGFVGDREFVLINERDELLAPAQHAPFLPLDVDYRAAEKRLILRYPDGREVSRLVELAKRPDNFDYLGMRDIALHKVLGDWDEELSAFSGINVRLYQCERQGAGIDVLPITLLTTGSLRLLAEKLGEDVDHRRFRANIVIENDEPHIEDSWEGRVLAIGAARLRVSSPVPRCLITQLDPATGEHNLRIVRALHGYREDVRLPNGLMPAYCTPGFASYAEVLLPGELAVGDDVRVIDE